MLVQMRSGVQDPGKYSLPSKFRADTRAATILGVQIESGLLSSPFAALFFLFSSVAWP